MNNKWKNFFYNNNDIVVALVIMFVAMGLIFWRLDLISKYPAQQAAKQDQLVEETIESPEGEDQYDEREDNKANDIQENPDDNSGDRSNNKTETEDGQTIRQIQPE